MARLGEQTTKVARAREVIRPRVASDQEQYPRGATAYGRAATVGECHRTEAAAESTRHATLFSAAVRLGSLPERELPRELAAEALAAAARTLGFSNADADRTIRRGLAYGARHPRRPDQVAGVHIETRAETIAAVLSWLAAVHQDDELRTRAGASTVRILTAHAMDALAAGKSTLRASLREVAEAAGVSYETVRRHVPAMRRWMSIDLAAPRSGHRSTWRLALAAGVGALPLAPPKPESIAAPTDDLWRAWSTGWRAFYALTVADGPVSPATIAAEIGVTERSGRRILARLARLGVAHRDEDGWHALPDAKPERGIIPWHADRVARHRAQREVFGYWRREYVEAARRPPGEREALRAEANARARHRRATERLAA